VKLCGVHVTLPHAGAAGQSRPYPASGRHHHAEVAGHEGRGVIPHARCPPLPGRARSFSSPARPAAHMPADGAGRDTDPELQDEFCGNPLLAPGDVIPSHASDHPLAFPREPRPAGGRPPAPEQPDSLAGPAEQRGRLNDEARLPPSEAAREQDERESCPFRHACMTSTEPLGIVSIFERYSAVSASLKGRCALSAFRPLCHLNIR
jgi:hypothetical protein